MPSLDELRRRFDVQTVEEQLRIEAETSRRRQEAWVERVRAYNAKAIRPNIGYGYVFYANDWIAYDDSKWVEFVVTNKDRNATVDSKEWALLEHVVVKTKTEVAAPNRLNARNGVWGQIGPFADWLGALTRARALRGSYDGTPQESYVTFPLCEYCDNLGWNHADGNRLLTLCPHCAKWPSQITADLAHGESCPACP